MLVLSMPISLILQLRNRQTILVSLESTGPYQRNGASLRLYALCGSRDTIVLDSCTSEI